MYDFPLLALLSAPGLGIIYKLLGLKHKFAKKGLATTIILSLILSGWHNYIIHNQDVIQPSTENLVVWVPSSASSINSLGSKAAGYFIRTHSQDVRERVFTFGTGSAAYYAGRLDKSSDLRSLLTQGQIHYPSDIAEAIKDSVDWKSVKYFIITQDNALLWDYVNKHYSLEAIVYVRTEPSLYIYNTSEQKISTPPIVLKSEIYEERYNQEFGHWQEALPWFLPLAQERL